MQINSPKEFVVLLIDILPFFQKEFNHEELESLYFKTDHHWNMRGAFYAYEYTMNYISNHSKIYKNDTVKGRHI
ncbi:DHHW family protein [Bacillus sp. S14(2024)]|uniref:DHHW family protein n=1 Tax=Bacillus sp. S14(2024) TaxID=3162884 RepID=UPI003D215F1D